MFAGGGVWDEGLDPAQFDAVTHGDEPLVVMAGAGTGKTRVLTARVAWLLERGVRPAQIALLTFTRRAADEMLERAVRHTGARNDERPVGGTFHAVAHRHITAYRAVLDLPDGFGVLDPAGACDLMDLLRGEHDLIGTTVRFPRSATLVEIYSRCINNERPMRALVPAEYPWCEPHLDAIAALFRDFTARKRRSALLDFDDLLLCWRALLGDAQLGPRLAEQFRYVLVDEYQDVNTLQRDIVRLLAPMGRGLTVVGDEAQAIYGFRGSDAGRLRALVDSYPGATVMRLERNFRSRQGVLQVANAVRRGRDVLRLHSDRGDGRRPRLSLCHDAVSEARAVADCILAAHDRGIALHDQAVLVRAAHHSDLVEVELSVRKVPYRKYGGLRFLESAHVKDFVAAARLLDNPHDEVAWYRVLRLHRNVGPTRARALIKTAAPSTTDALGGWPDLVAAAPANTRTALSATLGTLLEARAQSTAHGRAAGVLAAVGPLVDARYGDAACRVGDLHRLVGTASVVDDFSSWLAELTLDPPASTGDFAREPHLDEDFVVISTIHSAKGLEWPVVHVPHLVDGAMPIDMALKHPDGLEEERRLLYVAITRAREELYLYAPLRLPIHRHGRDDKHTFAPLSRFLDDDVRGVLEVVEDAVATGRVTALSSGRVTVDLDALWS
jgi:DNA helicase-2/ATP-dependent DNA helicase PcrA